MIMVCVKWSEDTFQVASFKAEKVVHKKADAIHAGRDRLKLNFKCTRKKIILVLHVMKESVMELQRTTNKPG